MADDAELEVMTSITGAMKTEMTDEQRQLVVDWFGTKYGLGRAALPAAAPEASAPVTATGGKTKSTKKRRPGTTTPSGGAAPTNKPKGPVAHDKDLNLHPAGKQSFRDFVAEKKPADTGHEHNVVALYWLTQVAEVGTATAGQIFTCYRDAKWKLPADLRNRLQVTSSVKGWMHTKDTDNITITAQGINFVERELPRPDKAGK